MPRARPENMRTTTFPCFCGEMVEIKVRALALEAGEALTHKCRVCGVNWNIHVREHNGKFREVRYG